MKKLFVILLGLCVSFSLFGCTRGKNNVGSFNEISYEVCDAMFENDETFILVISQTMCEMCQEYKEVLTSFVKENKVDIVYVEADKNMDDFQLLLETRFPNVEETPTTLVVVNGVVRDTVVGTLTAEQISLLMNRNKISYGSLSELSYDKTAEWFDEEKDFIMIVSQTTCHICAGYKDHLLEYIDDLSVDFVYIEADRDFDAFQSKLWDVYFPEVEETPSTCIVKDGKIVDFVVGDLSLEQVKKLLGRNGVVYE